MLAQWVENPPAVQERQDTWVRSLGQEASPPPPTCLAPEEEKPVFLPGQRSLVGYSPWGGREPEMSPAQQSTRQT